MAYRYGDREQFGLFPQSIEDYVSKDDPVRVYDAFVETVDFGELGIEIDEHQVGNSEYDPKAMLKLLVVWVLLRIPSMEEFKEVSSASNARDYQARRGNIRFRRGSTGRPEYVDTLNASGLATSRLLPAILEQNQRADGTVAVPEVLQKWVGKQILG